VCTGELGYILDGNICSGVDVTQPNLPSGADFKQQPSLANKMHVVFFVVPCEEATNPEFMARLRTLKCFCTDRGDSVDSPLAKSSQAGFQGQEQMASRRFQGCQNLSLATVFNSQYSS